MEFFRYGLLIALAIALVLVAVGDIRHRRISNVLNATIALGAPLFWIASGLAFWPDIVIQIGLALGVFAICCGLNAMGWLGGGDVKLLGALALWLTPLAFVDFLFAMAVFGGGLAIIFVIRRTIWRSKTKVSLPYGVAITAGGLWVLGSTYLPQAALAAIPG